MKGFKKVIVMVIAFFLLSVFNYCNVKADTRCWPVGGDGGVDQNNWPKYNTSNSYHSGTDISAPTGTEIYSVYDGVVDTVRSMTSSYGNHVIIKCYANNQTVYIYYCHMSRFANISVGQSVSAGTLIGYVGATGNASGPHLHYEVRDVNKRYGSLQNPNLNPHDFLPPKGTKPDACNCDASYAGIYTVTASGALNMRSGHGTQYGIVASIPTGTQVTVTKGNGTWAHVEWNGVSGYCNMSYLSKDNNPPVIEKAWIEGVNAEGYMIKAIVNDDTGIKRVACATWTSANGQDDIKWNDMVLNGNEAAFFVSFSEHGNQMDYYCNHLYAYDAGNNVSNCMTADYDRAENAGDLFYARITNTAYNKCIVNKLPNVELWERNERADELWKFKRESSGNYQILSCLDGMALDVNGGYATPETNVQIYEPNSSDAQKWYLCKNGNGYNLIPACATGCTIDCKGGIDANGTNIHIWNTGDRTIAQIFQIENVENIDSYLPIISNTDTFNDESCSTAKDIFVPGETIYLKPSYKNVTNVNLQVYKNSQIIRDESIKESDQLISVPNLEEGSYRIKLSAENYLDNAEIVKDIKVESPEIKINKFAAEPSNQAASGKQVKLSAEAEGGDGQYKFKFSVSDDKGNRYCIQDFSTDNSVLWTCGAGGKKVLTVDIKDGNGKQKSKNLDFVVVENKKPLDVLLSAAPGSNVESGETVLLKAEGKGGNGDYLYKFLVNDDKGNWYKIQDYSKAAEVEWITGAPGMKTLYVDMKDSAGEYKRFGIPYEVKAKDKELNVEFMTEPKGTAITGETVKLTAHANGGSGGYTYKFLVSDNNGNWYKIQDYSDKETADWTTGAVGRKNLYVDVTDSKGNYIRKEISFEVKPREDELSVLLTAEPGERAESGDSVRLTAIAEGGSGKYTYKFLVCDNKGNWYKIRDYDENNTVDWITGASGDKTLYVDVRDEQGAYIRQELLYKVE